MAHTPGPWGQVYDGSSTWSVGHEDDPQAQQIASVRRCSTGQDGWNEAADNARLIAAAPDLLAACERALEEAGELHCATRRGDIRAAIAKATGR